MRISKTTLLVFLFLPLLSSADIVADLSQIPADSLEKRYKLYQEHFFHHLTITKDFDSALFVTNLGMREFKSNPNYCFRFYRNKGIYYDYLPNKDSSIFYLKKATTYAKKVGDSEFVTYLYIDIGLFYFNQSQMDSSVIYYLKALEENKTAKDMEVRGIVHNNLGLIKMRQKEYEEAITYFKESINDYKASGSDGSPRKIISAYYNLAMCFEKLTNYDEALSYSTKVIDWALKNKDTLLYVENIDLRSKIFIDLERYDEALEILLLANTFIGDRMIVQKLPILSNIANVYYEQGEYDSSVYYAKMGLQLSKVKENKRGVIFFTQHLQFTYEKMKDFENAYQQLKDLFALYEEDQSIEEYKIANELENKYRNKKKAQEIFILKQKARINNLIILCFVVIILLGGSIGYLFFRRKRIRHALELAAEKENVSRSILLGQENERKRISEDLHDSVSASLANICIQLDIHLDKTIHSSDYDWLEKLKIDLNETIAEVRTVSHNLAPYKIEQEGLKSSIEGLLHDLNYTDVTHFKSLIELNEANWTVLSKSMIYRIIQEQTANIIKHANAIEASISIEELEDSLVIVVKDDGVGFDQNKVPSGIGIKNIRSRVAYLDGDLELISKPNYGTLFTITIPVKATHSQMQISQYRRSILV